MKAFSLWQPHASLVIKGLKHYETRHWWTRYRGLLAIHAAKRWTKAEILLTADLRDRFRVTTFDCLEYWPTVPLPLGAMLGIVRLVGIYQTQEIAPHLSLAERAFGNYAPGRFAWKLEVVEVFETPIPTAGHQGFWNWERPAA